MSPELSNVLLNKYDHLFRDQETGMFSSRVINGLECGDGWYDIVESLLEVINAPLNQLRQEKEQLIGQLKKLEDFLLSPKLDEHSMRQLKVAQEKLERAKKNIQAAPDKKIRLVDEDELKQIEARIDQQNLTIEMIQEELAKQTENAKNTLAGLKAELADITQKIEVFKTKGPKIVQVKEKFGELRVYGSSIPDDMRAAISMASRISLKTCEECGSRGRLVRMESLYQTLCETHALQFARGRKIEWL